jgi:threonine/homoserine/homoserine lactone efflux protein
MIAFLIGIQYGLLLSLFVGPSFFYLISTSISQGYKKAIAVALGIFLSDFLLLAMIFLGVSKLFESYLFQQFFSFISALITIILGVQYLNNSGKKINIPGRIENKSFYRYIFKGFTLNFLNPFTIAIWVGVVGSFSLKFQIYEDEKIYFFVGVLLVVLTMDSLKAIFSEKLKIFLNQKNMIIFNKVLGIIFLLLSVRFIYYFYIIF